VVVALVDAADAGADVAADARESLGDEACCRGVEEREHAGVGGVGAGGEAEFGDDDRFAGGEQRHEDVLVAVGCACVPVVVDADPVGEVPVDLLEGQAE
jgi:hypothetical protein